MYYEVVQTDSDNPAVRTCAMTEYNISHVLLAQAQPMMMNHLTSLYVHKT